MTAETIKKTMMTKSKPPIPNPPIIKPPINVPTTVPIPMRTCLSDIALAKSSWPTMSEIHAIGVVINDTAAKTETRNNPTITRLKGSFCIKPLRNIGNELNWMRTKPNRSNNTVPA